MKKIFFNLFSLFSCFFYRNRWKTNYFSVKPAPAIDSNRRQRIRGLCCQHSPGLVLGSFGGLVWSRTLKTWKTVGFTASSLKSVEKVVVVLCFRSKMLKKCWFYNVCVSKCWKSIGFIMFSFRNIEKALVSCCFQSKKDEKALVLQCFRSEMLNKHLFYSVFAPKCWKNNPFTVFSLQNVEKPLVLQAKRP